MWNSFLEFVEELSDAKMSSNYQSQNITQFVFVLLTLIVESVLSVQYSSEKSELVFAHIVRILKRNYTINSIEIFFKVM